MVYIYLIYILLCLLYPLLYNLQIYKIFVWFYGVENLFLRRWIFGFRRWIFERKFWSKFMQV